MRECPSTDFIDFDRAVAFLKSFTDYEQKAADKLRNSVLDLSRMAAMNDFFDRPDRSFKSVHITGSKGKGSTTFFVDAILRAHGLKTGRFISPHLERLNERIAIDGEPLSDHRFAVALERLRPYVDGLRRKGSDGLPTFFESITEAAFLEFAHEKVDCAVVEVGLGGRLDATNIIISDVAVIVSLDLEHTRILGPTIDHIAFEKSGIVKPDRPLISGVPRAGAGGRVIERIAAERGAPTTFIDEALRLVPGEVGGGRCRFTVEIDGRTFRDLEIRSFGKIQMHNAALAIAACKKLEESGLLRLDRDLLATALLETELPARVEYFPAHSTRLDLPYPICLDSAHTPKSMAHLAESLGDIFPGRLPTLLVGLLKDKNLEACIRPFAGRIAGILATDVRSPRALSAYDLLCRIRATLPEVPSAILPSIAADPSQLHAIDVPALVVAGSAYLAGDLRRALVRDGAPTASPGRLRSSPATSAVEAPPPAPTRSF